MTQTQFSTTTPPLSFRPVSWGAIFVGVILALFFGSLLNLLGLGLGLTAFSVDSGMMATLGIGSIIWLILSGILSMFMGGWVAGRLARGYSRTEGLLHGLATGSLAILISFIFMMSTAGMLLSGMGTVVTQTMTLAGKGAASIGNGVMQAAPGITQVAQNVMPDLSSNLNELTTQADQVLAESAKSNTNSTSQSPEENKTKLTQLVTAFLTAANQDDASSARQKLVEFLAENTSLDKQQINERIDTWQQKYTEIKAQLDQKAQEAKQTAIAATEQTTTAMGTVFIIAFLVFLLSALASAIGGLIGNARNTETRTY